jgi:phage tail sheath protein FI
VYIEEVPSGVRTIVGVSTSVAAFVGYFSRGPLDRAVQLFNMGDFQREFGGLRSDSEASYGIQQFFLNGGTQAWVVRTASGSIETAEVDIQDEAGNEVLTMTAGRQIKGDSVDDPGVWGNALRVEVDYDTSDPLSSLNLFNLTVSEIEVRDGRDTVLRSETHRNLTMTAGHSANAIATVNAASKIIQLSRDSGWPLNRPARTGTWSGDASGAAAALVTLTSFDIHYGGDSTTVDIAFTTQPANLAEVRRLVQSAIRAAGAALTPPEPLLTGASVQILGDFLGVFAGRSGVDFDAETIFTFVDNSGAPATALALAGVAGNVQQYRVGSPTASVGARGAAVEGHDGSLPTATELRGIRDPDKSGMYALEDVDLFNILCIPAASELDLTDPAPMSAVISEAEAYCEERRAFLLVDLPSNEGTMQQAREWLEDNATLRHRNGAAYFPRPMVPDALDDYRLRSIGPSGTVAGLMARTDATRGVWKAPAGIDATLRNVPDLSYKLTDAENGQLNPLGLNSLRSFDVYGSVCWGARTLVGADQQASEWKYVPVRRIALFIEESLFRGTQWVVFEPNDEPLWAQIRLNIGAFMQGLFRQGAFQGVTPKEAYFVKCDKETTTQNDIDRGIVNIVVGFAPLKPAEFVIIKLQQIAGQTEA